MGTSNAMRMAAEIVKAGLEGGTIQLNGPTRKEHAEAAATADGDYLKRLLDSIKETLIDVSNGSN